MFARMYRETANWPAEQACYLNVGEVDELGLRDGLVCLPEHALLEQQPALLQVLLLAVLHFVQHICYVLVVIQQHVLIWVGLAHVSLVVHCLHHTAMLSSCGMKALHMHCLHHTATMSNFAKEDFHMTHILCHADQQQAEAILVSMAGRTGPIMLDDVLHPADAVTRGCIVTDVCRVACASLADL